MSIRTLLLVLLIPLAGLLGILVALSVGLYWHQQQTMQQNRELARLMVDRIIMRQHWVELETNEKFKNEVVAKLAGPVEAWRGIRPAELRRGDAAFEPQDLFEKDLLARFAPQPATTNQASMFAERFAQNEYQYYQPIFAEKLCVDCHRIHSGNPRLSAGDLLSIIQVRLPQK